MSVSAPGGAQLITVANPAPAAGADWSYTIPAGRTQKLLMAFVTLVASASVGNRNAGWKLQNAQGVELGEANTTVNIVAGATQLVTYERSGALSFVAAGPAGAAIILPLPDLILPSGFTIQGHTLGILAGDQWSIQQLLLEDWGNQPGLDQLPQEG